MSAKCQKRTFAIAGASSPPLKVTNQNSRSIVTHSATTLMSPAIPRGPAASKSGAKSIYHKVYTAL